MFNIDSNGLQDDELSTNPHWLHAVEAWRRIEAEEIATLKGN